jgi:hypothetical protein
MDSDQRTALSGTLIRWRKNIWAWSDHSPAPEVRDLSTTDYYNFRIRNRRWIEVLVRLAGEKEALHWVTRGGYDGRKGVASIQNRYKRGKSGW